MDNSPRTILLVEDDPLHGMMLEMVLTQDGGFEVLPAHSAAEALQVLALRSNVSLVLSDQTMPGDMDGFALVHHVAAHWPDIPLILISGRPPYGQLPDGARFLFKPADNELLLSVVSDMILHRNAYITRLGQLTHYAGPGD